MDDLTINPHAYLAMDFMPSSNIWEKKPTSSLGAGVVLWIDENKRVKVALGIRKHWMNKGGHLSLPAGYVELDDVPAGIEDPVCHTALIELEQETNLKVALTRVINVVPVWHRVKRGAGNKFFTTVLYPLMASLKEAATVRAANTHEMFDWEFYTEEEVTCLYEMGMLAYDHEYRAIMRFFNLQKLGHIPRNDVIRYPR